MSNTEFSVMKEQVIEALTTHDDNAPIWYFGEAWIRLTERQHKKIIDILTNSDLERDENHIFIPSGLGIALNNRKGASK